MLTKTLFAVLAVLASEPDSTIAVDGVVDLVNRDRDRPLYKSTIRARLYELRDLGFATSTTHFDRDKYRTLSLWSVTDEGIRANLDRRA